MVNQARILWCDAEANCQRMADRAGVAQIVRKARGARISTIVVDVKPLIGEVLYKSRIAPRLSGVKGFVYPPEFDLLKAMIDEGHAAGMEIHANINVFSEGHRQFVQGPGFARPDWQVVIQEADDDGSPVFRPMADSRVASFGLFVNPIGPAREYELSIVREIMENYEVDGIIFDRMRYPNLYGDFSDLSRERFTAWLGAEHLNWPDDVLRVTGKPEPPVIEGKYYREWIEWRAQQITDFARDAASLSRSVRPDAKVGVYVGSWYESYFHEGVNWGSSKYHAGCSWMTPTYNRTGFAEFFDYVCTGCYYPVATREEARTLGKPEGATVEAACDQSRSAIMDAAPFYASLYLKDYEGNPEAFEMAVRACLENSDGVMLFDLVYLEDYDWWHIIEGVFAQDVIAPHDTGK
jgi:hypothetical protein